MGQAAVVSTTHGFELTIDTTKPGPVINKNVYGQFAEHLGTGIYEGLWVGPDSRIPNTRGWRNDVVGALKELKVPLVRWPMWLRTLAATVAMAASAVSVAAATAISPQMMARP